QLWPGRRLRRQELGPEEARVDGCGCDAERRDLRLQRLHPALEAELRRGVGRAVLEADEPGAGRDRDDVARTLRAHEGQDGACDVQRADEVRRQLLVDLLRRQLLEVARVKAARVV